MGYFCGYPHFYPAKVILFCDIDKYFYDRLCFFRKLPTSFGSTIGDLWDIYGLSVAVILPFFGVPLYIIVVLNTQRFGGSVLNIGDFGEYNGIYNTRKV